MGKRAVLSDPYDLALYEFDGGVDKALPDAVVFPQSTADVVAIVKIARYYDVPIVGRGAGTGLSGGAIPRAGGIVVSFARMNRILEIDIANERALVEPGVVNLDISNAVDAFGYFYAPDPSSQKACTIGGNVAENAGGPAYARSRRDHKPRGQPGSGSARFPSHAIRRPANSKCPVMT